MNKKLLCSMLALTLISHAHAKFEHPEEIPKIIINLGNSVSLSVTAGGLNAALGSTNVATITQLTLTGSINATDIVTIKKMTSLAELNLSNATIVGNVQFAGVAKGVHVILPNDLLILPAYTFKGFNGKVTLPNALEEIGNEAFFGAVLDNLNFSLTPNLKMIRMGAFSGTTFNTSNTLDFSKNNLLTGFESRAYAGTFEQFKGHVILPENLKLIPAYTFKGFNGKVTLPGALEEIGDGAFTGAVLDNINFSLTPNLKTIRVGAFNGTTFNTSNTLDFSKNTLFTNFIGVNYAGTFEQFKGHVILPENLKLIPAYTFKGFNGKVTLPGALEEIGDGAFTGAVLDNINFSLTPNLKTIRVGAFNGTTFNTSNTLDFSKNTLFTNFIGVNYAGTFEQFKGHVILPENLKLIPAYAFKGFNGKVTLPGALEEIGDGAFLGAVLDNFNFSLTLNLKTIRVGAFSGTTFNTSNTLDFSKNTLLTSFIAADYVGTFEQFKGHIILPENLKVIPAYTFLKFQGKVTLPGALEEIGTKAFAGAVLDNFNFSLTPILRKIDIGAFNGTIFNTSNTLDFSKNTLLKSFIAVNYAGTFELFKGHVILPESLLEISAYTFKNFEGKVTIFEGLKTIASNAFYNAVMTEIELPSTLNSIGGNAFYNVKSLTKIISHNPTPPTLGLNVFAGIDTNTTLLEADVCTYFKADQWKDFLKNADLSICDPDYGKRIDLAPNSYIFDIDKANAENIGGLYIPVKKAFKVWQDNDYFKNPIPQGQLSASLKWEDVPGLVEKIEMVDPDSRNLAKIKVMIDKRKGEGNAIIAFHVGANGNSSDPVYWSWHVWVTDDPTKNAKTLNNNPTGTTKMISTFMDRNLGALSSHFIGNDWARSGGLMYQWGRKDPFPTFLYLDGHTPEIHIGNNNFINRWNYPSYMKLERPFYSEVEKNIQASINNPEKFFSPLESEYTEIWDKDLEKYMATRGNVSWLAHNISVGVKEKALDLWGDNWGGEKSDGGWKVAQAQKTPFDPCPSGWKVPSYANRTTYDRFNSSPWGKFPTIGWKDKNGPGNHLWTEFFGIDYPLQPYKYSNSGVEDPVTTTENKYPGVKIYPGLGMDFSGVPGYDIGAMPLAGHYVGYYGYNPNRGLTFQDQASELGLWGATLEIDGWAKMFSFSASNFEEGKGRYWLVPEGVGAGVTYNLNAVRCIKQDRTDAPLFDTEYIPAEKIYYNKGLQNPNTYLLTQSADIQEISIPVNKAFSVYNQYFTNAGWPQGDLSSNVYWTTNTNLVKSIVLDTTQGNKENSLLKVQVNPNQTGNAVVSIHVGNNKNSKDEVLWSWHIWVTKDEVKSKVYQSEKQFSESREKLLNYKNFLVYETTSGSPLVKNIFMDRDLGALDYDITKEDFVGMHYQWGRKDPIPNFVRKSGTNYNIYIGSTITGKQGYTSMTSTEYDSSTYVGEKNFASAQDAIRFVNQNPLSFVKDKENSWMPYATANNGSQLWGKGIEKSPFDPCPDTWRVPEGGYWAPSSPWYKEGTYDFSGDTFYPIKEKTADNLVEIPAQKPATYIEESGKINSAGFIFTKPDYNLGMYSASGYRGFGKEKYNVTGLGAQTALWVAALANWNSDNPNKYSSAFGFYFSATEANIIDITPIGVGKSVRCVKDTQKTGVPARMVKQIPTVNNLLVVNGRPETNEVTTLSDSQIQITPNPTSGIFKVFLPNNKAEGSIQVINVHNRVIFVQPFKASSEVNVDISSFPAGVYIVNIQTGNQNITKKLIKK